MLIYFIVLFILLIFSLIEILQKAPIDNNNLDTCYKSITLNKNSEIIKRILIWFFICLIGFFRSESMGYDSNNYFIYYFNRVELYSWKELLSNFQIDNGYYLLNKLIYLITSDYWIYRGILFVIVFSLYFVFFKKESPYLALSILIFFGQANLNILFSILRQSIAGGISIYSLRQIKKKHYLRSLLIVLFASTFHKSALIMLMIFPISMLKRKLSNTKLLIISVISILFFIILLPRIVSIYAGGRYNNYSSNGGYYILFLLAVSIIGTGIAMDRINPKDRWLILLYNIAAFTLAIQIGALQWALFTRIRNYYSVILCFLIPKLLALIPQKRRLILTLIIVVGYGFMFIYSMADSPYSFHIF